MQTHGEKVVFFGILVEGQSPTKPATKGDVDSWISLLKIPYSVGCDLPDTPLALKKALGPRETAYLLERETMKILAKAPTLGALWPSVEALP